MGSPSTLPDALLFVLSVFFRKIFILQLVGLVLTHNFTDCDFEKIRTTYREVIFGKLNSYMNGTKCTLCNNYVYCKDRPDCLSKIVRLTFYPTHGCTSLAKEIFAMKTNATLTLQCPGYSGIRINNTQAMKKREDTTNECRDVVSNLIRLWARFTRI
ncbi:thymic stromal lymphopoietin [Pteropus medius]|uniref:Thymic stromal lymphopoietin n=1 Tax=Pteropus vampyrus TaxID=132908 RepID=A0A6P3QG22_PTEVA|nr:thymic stromal lymphopoietin [Pteropus vampyrus]XP_039704282.1 thymic stromal lymphopoietin [Pteropus giganteus]